MAEKRSTPRPRLRGAKVPLSRDAVVAAAVACLREGGPSGLTMRRVAAHLETGAGSLYAHVRDQRELYVLVLDEIVRHVLLDARPPTRPAAPLPSSESAGADSGTAWQDATVALLRTFATTLMAYPGAARLAMLVPATGPAALDFSERLMTELLAGGLNQRAAAWALDSLVLLVTASISEQDTQAADRPGESIADSYREAFDRDPARRPNLIAAREAVFAGGGFDRLEWAIRAFLTGVARHPLPAG